jgi:hypothetical protein
MTRQVGPGVSSTRLWGRAGRTTNTSRTMGARQSGREPTTALEAPLAHTVPLAEATLHKLVAEIGRHPGFASRGGSKRRLAEHFEIWTLTTLDLPLAPVRLEAIARRTDYWHHQIRCGRSAYEFARSKRQSGDVVDYRVHAVFASPIAQKLARVISWIDRRNDTDTHEARFLTLPSHATHAIWLRSESEDRIVVIDKPVPRRGPSYRRYYDAGAFVRALKAGPTAPALIKRGAVD